MNQEDPRGPESELRAAAFALMEAEDAYRDARNGIAHPGKPHDRTLHFDPCIGLPDVHVYDEAGDCAACAGAQYGTEDTKNRASVRLRMALGIPLRPFEAWRVEEIEAEQAAGAPR